jgi:hypothetical protein
MFHSQTLRQYDVSFKKLAVDTCDTCDRLRNIIRDPDTTDAEVNKAEASLLKHLVIV